VTEDAAKPPLRPVERPLMLGEVFAETIRVYGERIWFAFGLGVSVAAAIALAAVIRNDIITVAIFTWAFAALFALAVRYIEGDSVGEALRLVGARAPVLFVLGVVVTLPLALGVFDPLIGLVVSFWLGVMSFAIPVAVTEDVEGGFAARVGYALRRSYAIGRAEYLHAVGVVAAFVIVYGLFGRLLVQALGGFADNGLVPAVLITEGFLLPFLFLGLAVLYFEQRSRAISSR
jgi:hypothetical protein